MLGTVVLVQLLADKLNKTDAYQLVVALDLADLLVDALDACGYGNAFGSLHLIASQHPDLDAAHPERLDRGSHFVLQLVLYPGDAYQVHLLLQGLHHFFHLLVPVLYQIGCLFVLLVPGLKLFLAQLLVRNDQGPQALSGQGVALVLDVAPEDGLAPVNHHHICSLQV